MDLGFCTRGEECVLGMLSAAGEATLVLGIELMGATSGPLAMVLAGRPVRRGSVAPSDGMQHA